MKTWIYLVHLNVVCNLSYNFKVFLFHILYMNKTALSFLWLAYMLDNNYHK